MATDEVRQERKKCSERHVTLKLTSGRYACPGKNSRPGCTRRACWSAGDVELDGGAAISRLQDRRNTNISFIVAEQITESCTQGRDEGAHNYTACTH